MAIDLKYGKFDIEGIGENEPIFILRGRDLASTVAILAYYEICAIAGSPKSHLENIMVNVEYFNKWQAENESAMQIPQSTGRTLTMPEEEKS